VKDLLSSTPLIELGWIVALSTLVPLGVGVFLDRRFGTAPLFIIIGAAFGILAGTIGAVRITNRAIDALGNRPPSAEAPAERPEDRED
jgi:F0F1-type ATP synthase assembly protein I